MNIKVEEHSSAPVDLRAFLMRYPYLPYHYIPGNTAEQRADYCLSLMEGKRIFTARDGNEIVAAGSYCRCPWDEELFEFNFGRLRPVIALQEDYEKGRAGVAAIGKAVLEIARSEKVKFIDTKCETFDSALVHGLEDSGFRVVNCEGTHVLLSSHGAFYLSESIRRVTPDDIEQLKDIARVAFVHNRFVADPRFDRVKAREFYAKWLTSAAKDSDNPSKIVIAHQGDSGALYGFSIGHVCEDANRFLNKKVGSLDLTGVLPKYQAHRVGTALVSGVVDYVSQTTDFVETVISVQNSPSARGVTVMRFRIKTVRFDMHCWC